MKWVSVKDKLPEELELVLVSAIGSYFPESFYFIGYLEHGSFWDMQNDCSYPVKITTHWTEIPEPPK